jgi:FixJ family two-component response regulator
VESLADVGSWPAHCTEIRTPLPPRPLRYRVNRSQASRCVDCVARLGGFAEALGPCDTQIGAAIDSRRNSSIQLSSGETEMTARILVVDDMPEMQRSMAALLGEAGYWVLTASTLQAGQHLADYADPDLLLVDVRLGAYNGLQLALRERVSHPTRPVIIISDHEDPVLEAEAKRLGAHFLEKPIEPTLLLTTIEQMLAERDVSDEERWHPVDRRYASEERRQHDQAVVHDRRTRRRRATDIN